MRNDVYVKNGIIIPDQELEITTSRSGGAGGQHVNKTDTRITIRWNVNTTAAFNDDQKALLLTNLANRLTAQGDLIISNSESRSQQTNRENALKQLGFVVAKALYVPRKRMKTRVPKSAQEARLQSKSKKSSIKNLRSKKHIFD